MSPRLSAVLALLANVCSGHAWPHPAESNVLARIDSGKVYGLRRYAEGGLPYASFRGVPYAKQPLGELRFKELQPADPWDFHYAHTEGPTCMQTDVLYGRLAQPQGSSEACIHANVHVPLPADRWELARDLEPPYTDGVVDLEQELGADSRLPILVFIHGGGFAFGSGDADLHGPEYLVSKDVIVITFNYRLNVFGFLSLNTTEVPGNAGLRDMVTLLRWVQRNARAFGGDPDNVTIAGQSAGAIAAHLLTLSEAADGLFHRAILMSGLATSGFYSPSPAFAQFVAAQLLTVLGIKTTNPDEIHKQLIEMPAEKLNEANAFLIDQFGLTSFMPTVESPLAGVTTILDGFPDNLVAKGRGRNIPLLIGFTDAECETFRPRFATIDIIKRIKENPTLVVPSNLIFSTPPDALLEIVKKIDRKYFNDTVTLDKYVKLCSDSYFEYPALEYVLKRVEGVSAPAYLYRFEYESDHSVLQEALGWEHQGAGHIEDLTYIFKVNSMPWIRDARDEYMKNQMVTYFTNFMKDSVPSTLWPAVTSEDLQHEAIQQPELSETARLSERQEDLVTFFSSLSSTKGTQ